MFDYWMVIGRTINGSYFYTDTFENFNDRYFYINSMSDIIKFFGGGIVQLIYVDDFDYDIISVYTM